MKIDSILDTTVLIDLLRQNSTVILWQQSLGLQRVAITPIVWMEVIQGARNNSERAHILRFLRQFFVEHTVSGDHNWAMLQFAQYNLSHGVELTDVLIASVAVRLAVPLYTLNIKHYAPLPGVDARKPY